ncbi:hypothetical protein TELCIR_03808 [Teladorsagia circumcincta]|uniref:TUG ubiquitin-like domain-containing protein n=1 Tax=Teladorsagia circumcincta TaxID=45464 RepID=A0A2G9UXE9_TELCI|nr:hypothetical protein TELCIR_03808 [Teladorsagia circumcincta]
MEMFATTMAVRMAQTIYKALADQLKISSIVIFTDSEIVLNWLATYPIKRDVGRFVTNRVAEIRAIVNNIDCPTRFGHVTTNENPADSATRGLSAKEIETHLWWEGPDFLKQPEENWSGKRQLITLPEEIHAEDRETIQQTILNTKTTLNMENINDVELLDWNRHNTIDSAQTSIAYALRFLRKLCCRIQEKIATRIITQVPELRIRPDSKFITVAERKAALQVLEEACLKSGFDADEYQLSNQNRHVDLALPFRLSGLPNNATLEMVQAARTASDSMVTIALQRFEEELRTKMELEKLVDSKVAADEPMDVDTSLSTPHAEHDRITDILAEEGRVPLSRIAIEANRIGELEDVTTAVSPVVFASPCERQPVIFLRRRLNTQRALVPTQYVKEKNRERKLAAYRHTVIRIPVGNERLIQAQFRSAEPESVLLRDSLQECTQDEADRLCSTWLSQNTIFKPYTAVIEEEERTAKRPGDTRTASSEFPPPPHKATSAPKWLRKT